MKKITNFIRGGKSYPFSETNKEEAFKLGQFDVFEPGIPELIAQKLVDRWNALNPSYHYTIDGNSVISETKVNMKKSELKQLIKECLIETYSSEGNYCPKCRSKLYSGDTEYMDATGVCSYCVTNDKTSDKRFQKALQDYMVKNKSRKIQEWGMTCMTEDGASDEDIVDLQKLLANPDPTRAKEYGSLNNYKRMLQKKINALKGDCEFCNGVNGKHKCGCERIDEKKGMGLVYPIKPTGIGDGFYIMGTGVDKNGNFRVLISHNSRRARSIQTNGNTPAAHQKSAQDIIGNPEAVKQLKDYYLKYLEKR